MGESERERTKSGKEISEKEVREREGKQREKMLKLLMYTENFNHIISSATK